MTPSARSILTAGALCLAFAGCRSSSPEDQIRRAFATCAAAVEAGDAAGAVAPLDPAFRGPEGMDRGLARLYLEGLFRREKVGLTVFRNEVRVQGAAAHQEVELLLTGRSGSLLPQEASRRTFDLQWRQTRDGWRILSVEER